MTVDEAVASDHLEVGDQQQRVQCGPWTFRKLESHLRTEEVSSGKRKVKSGVKINELFAKLQIS